MITRRRIPLDHLETYSSLWNAVRAGAEQANARAWLFEAEDSGDRFVEFIEWQADHDVRAVLQDALAELNAAFPAQDSETWLETKI